MQAAGAGQSVIVSSNQEVVTPVTEDSNRLPVQMGFSLNRLIRQRGLAERSGTDSLDHAWKKVVGDEIGRHSAARKIRGGVVDVEVSNSAILEQLRGFMHQTVLKELQEQLPQSEIKAIRYRRRRS